MPYAIINERLDSEVDRFETEEAANEYLEEELLSGPQVTGPYHVEEVSE